MRLKKLRQNNDQVLGVGTAMLMVQDTA